MNRDDGPVSIKSIRLSPDYLNDFYVFRLAVDPAHNKLAYARDRQPVTLGVEFVIDKYLYGYKVHSQHLSRTFDV